MNVANRSEKIGCGPALWTVKAQSEEILLCIVCRTEVETFTLVNQEDFVD